MRHPTKRQVPSNEQWPILLLRNMKTCLPSLNHNYSANYTLGKLILEAKYFIAFITTNIVLRYKLPGSLDLVTFYFEISNRFMICSEEAFFSP